MSNFNINYFRKKLLKNGFGYNLSIVTVGRSLSILIGLVFTPILTRIYDPVHYGEFNLYFSWINILQIFLTLSYVYAIVPSRTNRNAYHIAITCLGLSFIMSLIIYGVGNLASLFINKLTYINIFFVTVGVFLASGAEIMASLNVRRKEFKITTTVEMIRNLFVRVLSVILGLWSGVYYYGLIVADLTGKFLTSGFYLIRNFKNFKNFKVFILDTPLKKILYQNKSFPKFVLPSNLINRFSNFSIPIFIGNYFSTVYLGYFSLSLGLLNLPIQVLGSSISSVFFQKATDDFHKGKNKLGETTKKLVNAILGISIVPFSILAVYGDFIFDFIFGDQWVISGYVVQILSVSFIPMLISFSTYQLFIVINKQKIRLYFDLVLLILLLTSAIMAVILNDFFLLVVFISVSYFIIYNAVIIYLLKAINAGYKFFLIKELIVLPSIMIILFLVRLFLIGL